MLLLLAAMGGAETTLNTVQAGELTAEQASMVTLHNLKLQARQDFFREIFLEVHRPSQSFLSGVLAPMADKVKKHLKLGANPNWAFTGKINSVLDARLPSPKGSKLTPMHAAAWSGSKKALRRLLKAGGDANARSSDLSTPLIFAVMRNHAAAVKVLLKAGAATAPTDDGGMTAADWADDQDNAEIEAMLAAASASAPAAA